jgi:glucose/arabinose dehydrogenase
VPFFAASEGAEARIGEIPCIFPASREFGIFETSSQLTPPSQTGARAGILRREERLECVFQNVRGHSGTSISDGDGDGIHQNRHLAIDPKTGALYVGVGSSGNLGVEPEPKATIQRFDADGSNQTTFASGMRNATALAFHPQTGELWALVQERDGLGDNLPSDYLTRVQQGGFYGWPYAYLCRCGSADRFAPIPAIPRDTI